MKKASLLLILLLMASCSGNSQDSAQIQPEEVSDTIGVEGDFELEGIVPSEESQSETSIESGVDFNTTEK